MRYILIILVFVSVGAKAQMVIKAHANYRPLVQPAANLLLDDYPNAAAAYSLRKLDKDYTGAAIRVRKDTTGQPEQDIGFTASGDLDTAALKSFLNARNGRVVTWYDQSGNARNKTNSTAATQPEISFLGVIKRTNGKPCINFQALNVLTSASTYTITHHVMVAKVVTQQTINYSYTNANNGFFWNGTFSGVNGLGGFDGTNVRSITGEDLNQHLGFFSMRSNKLFITRDGGTETDAGSFAATITVDRLGGRQNASGIDFQGEVQEVVAWNSDQSSNRTGIENNINDYYNIYWNGDFTGILDTYPNSAAAYSLRNLSSTYKGALIRVRKDTTGQPEMDIYGDYYGNLDTVGLKNFLNARSGFVTTWYDQSGNGRNATQTIQANQPRIALTGTIDRQGTRPTIRFIAANSYYFLLPTFSTDTSYSAYMATKRTASNSIAPYLSSRSIAVLVAPWSDNTIMFHYRISTTNANSYALRKATDNTTTFNLIEAYANVSSQSVYRNNTLLTLGSAANFTSNQTTWGSIGTYAGIAFFPDGVMSEAIIYHSNQSSNRSGIATNINTYYSIY